MFIRFREMKAERYGDGKRQCAGACKNRSRYYPRYGAGMMVKGRTFLKGCPLTPICPLIKPRVRLEVSIVTTRRQDGKVKQEHVASLGSILVDHTIAERMWFWQECDERLARLANRLGPDLDRLRQAIAARIPPATDADRQAMDAAAWDQLESFWDRQAKSKARAASDHIQFGKQMAKRDMHAATEAEVMTLKAKRLRGNRRAYEALQRLLGHTLAADIRGSQLDRGLSEQLKQEVQAAERDGETE
jgi:hypothetical protein